MTSLTRWDPFADLRGTMDRLFDDGFYRRWRVAPQAVRYAAAFPVELSETEGEFEVKASLPGVKPDEVEITVKDGVLTIKAEHRDESEAKDEKRDFYRREIRYGAYHRSFSLPVDVDADKAEAHYENGMLSLRLPKAEESRPKQIKVAA